MAKLTDAQIQVAKAWLHDVFVWGHLIKNPVRDISVSDYWYMYGYGAQKSRMPNKYRVSGDQEACETICNTIRLRQAETKFIQKADAALQILAQCPFNPELHSTDVWKKTTKPADMLAKYIAWYCAEYGPTKNFWWSDANTSKYEMESIKNETILGKALWEAGCFTSQTGRPGKPAAASSAPSNTNNINATGAPKNGFKARGPLSGVAVDLLSTPNQKEFLSGKIFCIVGRDVNGKPLEDCAFIRPVETDQKIQQKYMKGATNKVLFGSAKGYGYCPCYFTTLQEANDFLSKINTANYKLNAKVSQITVFQKNAQSNGYFKIGTEFGPCYISAEKLNESAEQSAQETKLVEDATELDLTPTEEELKGNVGGLTYEEFSEAFMK